MSLGLSTFLAPQSIVEKVPAQVLPSPVSAASVVVGRNRSRFIPTSGATYASNGQTIVTFRISDTNAFLDLPTAVLHYRFNVPDVATAADQCLPDDGPAWISRVRVSVGGSVLVEDVQDINVAVNASAYSQMPKETYCSAAGQFAGFWRLNDVNYPNWVDVSGVTGPAVNQVLNSDQSPRTRANLAANSATNGYEPSEDLLATYTGTEADGQYKSFAIPLGFLTGLGRISTLFPLRLTGALEIVLYLENKNTALFNYDTTAPASIPDFSVQDVTIECDTVALAPSVVAAMDSLGAASSEAGGLMIPVDTLISNRISYTNAGSKSFQISRGTTQLISLQEVHRLAADVSDITAFSLSNFKNYDITRHQIRIGAALYPQTNSDSQARMWSESAHGAGRLNSLFPAGLIDRKHFTEDDEDDTRFVYNYNFEQVRNEQIALQGISTLASGSVVQVDLTNTPEGASTMNVFLTSRRYIALNNSSVSVIGN
jgi:hypothetical protein